MLSISNSNTGTPQSASSDKPQTPQPPSTIQQASGLRVPSNRKTIYDRHLNRSRNAELSRASFAYLFGEMVSYAQRRVTGIQDLEKRYVDLAILVNQNSICGFTGVMCPRSFTWML